MQNRLTRWLTDAARDRGWAGKEFPYRPAANLQFWYADVAYSPWRTEVAKIVRQRVAAFSCNTREFWVIDPEARSIEVSLPGAAGFGWRCK